MFIVFLTFYWDITFFYRSIHFLCFLRSAMRTQEQWSSWWINMVNITSSRSTPVCRWSTQLLRRSQS